MLSDIKFLQIIKLKLRNHKQSILLIFYTIHLVSLFPFALIFWMLRINLMRTQANRIGHLSADLETHVRKSLETGSPNRTTFLLIDKGKCANEHLLSYFSEYYVIVRNPFLLFILKPLSKHALCGVNSYNYTETLDQAEFYSAKRLGPKSPLLSITESDEIRGKKALENIGIPENSWYVCVHSRESGFSKNFEKKGGIPTDYDQAFRNSSILSYRTAMKVIQDRGGWCIRFGDNTMEPLVYNGNFVDYAHSNEKSDWLDIYLLANTALFLGNTSGPFNVASAYGTPLALANMIPLTHVFTPSVTDLAIPKLFRDKRSKLLVPFSEVLGTPAGNGRFESVYRDSAYDIVDNSEGDIADLLAESLDRLDGKHIMTEEDKERQKAFRGLFKGDEYSYYGLGNVSSSFLKKYEYLL